jgi:hypothetical protein
MQLKMVQQQLHLQPHKVNWYSTKTSTKNTTRLSKVAEKLRQIRDDESLSIIQRTQANKDLGVVLKQQLNRISCATDKHYLAKLIKAEGKSKEALEKTSSSINWYKWYSRTYCWTRKWTIS